MSQDVIKILQDYKLSFYKPYKLNWEDDPNSPFDLIIVRLIGLEPPTWGVLIKICEIEPFLFVF